MESAGQANETAKDQFYNATIPIFICRLCIKMKKEEPWPISQELKNIVKTCLPGILLDITTETPQLCKKCHQILMSFYRFRGICEEKQAKLVLFWITQKDTVLKVSLSDFYVKGRSKYKDPSLLNTASKRLYVLQNGCFVPYTCPTSETSKITDRLIPINSPAAQTEKNSAPSNSMGSTDPTASLADTSNSSTTAPVLITGVSAGEGPLIPTTPKDCLPEFLLMMTPQMSDPKPASAKNILQSMLQSPVNKERKPYNTKKRKRELFNIAALQTPQLTNDSSSSKPSQYSIRQEISKKDMLQWSLSTDAAANKATSQNPKLLTGPNASCATAELAGYPEAKYKINDRLQSADNNKFKIEVPAKGRSLLPNPVSMKLTPISQQETFATSGAIDQNETTSYEDRTSPLQADPSMESGTFGPMDPAVGEMPDFTPETTKSPAEANCDSKENSNDSDYFGLNNSYDFDDKDAPVFNIDFNNLSGKNVEDVINSIPEIEDSTDIPDYVHINNYGYDDLKALQHSIDNSRETEPERIIQKQIDDIITKEEVKRRTSESEVKVEKQVATDNLIRPKFKTNRMECSSGLAQYLTKKGDASFSASKLPLSIVEKNKIGLQYLTELQMRMKQGKKLPSEENSMIIPGSRFQFQSKIRKPTQVFVKVKHHKYDTFGHYIEDHDYLTSPYEENSMIVSFDGAYNCCYCHLCLTFHHLERHFEHMIMHHLEHERENKTLFTCKKHAVPKKFDSVYELNEHLYVHRQMCQLCGMIVDKGMTEHAREHLRKMEYKELKKGIPILRRKKTKAESGLVDEQNKAKNVTDTLSLNQPECGGSSVPSNACTSFSNTDFYNPLQEEEEPHFMITNVCTVQEDDNTSEPNKPNNELPSDLPPQEEFSNDQENLPIKILSVCTVTDDDNDSGPSSQQASKKIKLSVEEQPTADNTDVDSSSPENEDLDFMNLICQEEMDSEESPVSGLDDSNQEVVWMYILELLEDGRQAILHNLDDETAEIRKMWDDIVKQTRHLIDEDIDEREIKIILRMKKRKLKEQLMTFRTEIFDKTTLFEVNMEMLSDLLDENYKRFLCLMKLSLAKVVAECMIASQLD